MATENNTKPQPTNGKQELLLLLNNAKKEIYGPKCHPLTMGQLNFHAYDTKHRAYIDFQIPKKKRGEFRTISAPCPGLKVIQTCLCKILTDYYKPHAAAMGFVQGRSVADNAKVHVGQEYVYNIDLKNFFPSIKGGRIYKRLLAKPFLLDPATANMIVRLCCGVDENGVEVLPQGAPTSPILTNIICERLDRKLSKLAKAYDLRYTRYADDITFSGVNNKFNPEGNFCQALKRIIEEEEHLRINEDKTRVRGRNQRQEVTGLSVNEKANVSKDYVKQIRTMLANWEKSGYDYAQARFLEHYHPTKNVKGMHHIENILGGKLAYMQMVKGTQDPTYSKLNARYLALLQQGGIGPSGPTTPKLSPTLGQDFSSLIDGNELVDSLNQDLDTLLNI